MPFKMREDRWVRGLAFSASVILHLLIAAILIFGLPEPAPQPQSEEAISVELVPPPESSRNARADPYPVLQPVIQFGEKDAGPRTSPDGNSANDVAQQSAPQRDPEKADHAQPSAAAEVKATGEVPQAKAYDAPSLEPESVANVQGAAKLRVAKMLFSQKANINSMATVAMAYVAREVRVARLCATELKEQLLHASPSYFAEVVPFDRLKEGTIVENDNTAFRSNFEWYHLGYRCEVDMDATKVVSFAFDIGNRLTLDEWRRRGLPSQ